MSYRLTMDLTPRFMSALALRKRISDHRWRKIIVAKLKAERGAVCQICGFEAQESKHIDGHEGFAYVDDNRVTMSGIQLLCTWCHDVKDFAHTERLIAQGKKPQERKMLVINHFCRVNECSVADFNAHYKEAVTRVRLLEQQYGAEIRPDQIHYGEFHRHFLKGQEPDRFNGRTAVQRAITWAIEGKVIDKDYRDHVLDIATEDDQFREQILDFVRNENRPAAINLIRTALEEFFSDDAEFDDDEALGWLIE